MSVKETLRTYILDELLNSPDMSLADDAQLVESGLVNSIGLLRLVSFIEEHFKIEVPFEDVTLDNFASLNTISLYLEAQTAH